MTDYFWILLVKAIALVFVLEGILPFLSPNMWRDMMRKVSQLDDRTLRIMGLSSMLGGLLILFVLHSYVF